MNGPLPRPAPPDRHRHAVALAVSLAALGLASGPRRLAAQTAASTAPVDSAGIRPLTLGDAVRLATRNSASAQTARIRIGEARARVTEQRAALLPTVNADALQLTRTFNTASFGLTLPGFPPNGFVPPAYRNVDLRGRVIVPLLDLSAIGRVRAARGQVTATSAAADVAAEQAGVQAALAYVQALRAGDDLRNRTQDSVLAADLVRIARAQLQAGTGVALDVTRAQAQLAATRAQLIAARVARDRSLVTLDRAVGVPVGTALPLADSLGALGAVMPPAEDQAAAIQRALQNRPDLRAAAARVAAAQQGVAAIRMERLPSVTLAGDDGVNGLNYGHLLHTYQYSVGVSIPILDGFRREARVEEQQGAVREAQLQESDLRQQATADVQSALLELSAAQEQVAATREQLRLAEQEVQQARDRFNAGVAGNADVITALLNLTTARAGVTDALTNYQTARVALARAEGAVTSLP